MKSYLIRFESESKFLEDSLKNGFKLFSHPITYPPSSYEILKVLIHYWLDVGRSSSEIDWILEKWRKSKTHKEFFNEYTMKMNNDVKFKKIVSGLLNMAGSGKVLMKCFTELRDNQKIDTAHTGYFGEFGIAMKKEWGVKNGASQVIYVDKDSFLTNALGRLLAIYNNSVHIGKKSGKLSSHALRAFFDVWSYFEISDHSYEYEWRILGPSDFVGDPEGFEKRLSTVEFKIGDILGLFVPNACIDFFKILLEEKAKKEEFTGEIPPVNDVKSIKLSDEEREQVKKIFNRN